MADGSERRIRRGRKFDQVIEGAREVFLREGFDAASVDDIARAAGVSKATLYSYFPDKKLLFVEVARGECLRQADEAIEKIDMSAPVSEILRMAGHHMLDVMTSDFGQQMFRVFVAESERFPDLGRIFYESGPALVRRRLVEFFRDAVARGELAIEDYDLAADQFHMLCKVDIMDRLVFCNHADFGPAARKRVIDGAVRTFMARYGA